MQAGSVSTAGRKGWVRTRAAARGKPSDSLLPLGQQRSLTIASISTPRVGAYATIATRTVLAVQGTTSRAASCTPRTTPMQARQRAVRDASPRPPYERTVGGTGPGTPGTYADRASCANGTSHPRTSTNGWRCTTQEHRRQLHTSGVPPTARALHGVGNGTAQHRAADGATVRAGGSRSIYTTRKCTGPPRQRSWMSTLPTFWRI